MLSFNQNNWFDHETFKVNIKYILMVFSNRSFSLDGFSAHFYHTSWKKFSLGSFKSKYSTFPSLSLKRCHSSTNPKFRSFHVCVWYVFHLFHIMPTSLHCYLFSRRYNVCTQVSTQNYLVALFSTLIQSNKKRYPGPEASYGPVASKTCLPFVSSHLGFPWSEYAAISPGISSHLASKSVRCCQVEVAPLNSGLTHNNIRFLYNIFFERS